MENLIEKDYRLGNADFETYVSRISEISPSFDVNVKTATCATDSTSATFSDSALLFLQKGECVANGKIVRRGDGVLLVGGGNVDFLNLPNQYYSFTFGGRLSEEVISKIGGADGDFVYSDVMTAETTAKVVALFEAMQSKVDGALLALSRFYALCTDLVTNAGKIERDPLAVSKKKMNLIEAMNFILDNCCENTTVNDVANSLRLNPDYLSRVFKEYLGISMKTYIDKKRLSIAKGWLLDNEDMPIDTVRLNMGFSSTSYFAKAFKKEFGVSPRAFRDQRNAKKL